MVLKKYELEGKLGEESAMIKSGVLRDENPLDVSEDFNEFLLACRHGDLRKCQELINLGVNINGKDKFDYTPLIIASLCGHYELVRLLLEAGALAERNTFQGERCIYNALNDRIRNLLLQYDFSKSSDPYVYWSSHITGLMTRAAPKTSDITLTSDNRSFDLHKFILAARTPYFRSKLEAQPETDTWKLASAIPDAAFQVVLRYIYLGEVPKDLSSAGLSSSSSVSEEEIIKGLDKVSKQLEVEQLWEAILASSDRRLARQRYQDEVERALKQIGTFFRESVVGHKMVVDTGRVHEVKWQHDNSIFSDVLLRADEPLEAPSTSTAASGTATPITTNGSSHAALPIGPAAQATPPDEAAAAARKPPRKSVLYPAHKAMLIRSEYFERMFAGDFVESRKTDKLRIVTVDCSPPVLELILEFLYTETAACPLEHALDLLYAADMLFLDALKSKAAVAISALGSGRRNALVDRTHQGPSSSDNPDSSSSPADADADNTEPINIYDVIHAAWDLRVQRLEEFAARYLADRLEDYIDDAEFHELISESASRIQKREETDTIELLDDIRYYLSERFRLRFEDAGLEDIMDEAGEMSAEVVAAELVAADGAAGPDEKEKVDTNGHDVRDIDTTTTTTTQAAVEKEMEPFEQTGVMRTLDGEAAEDEFASDAINYQLLLGKIDAMLDGLKLDA
ncbi:hypothetical protein K4F52_005109 [Lecanicillium sp. MT-2017a]|nr:hypothetical protein K4F52_005109 [Lecanicillium sp. MT-2017a]